VTRLVRLVAALLVVLVAAGCGDGLGYQLVIDNGGPADIVVVASGAAQDQAADEMINDPAFMVKAGARAITPWVRADIGADGRWEMGVTVLSGDCTAMGSVDLAAGPSLLRVDGTGAITSESARDAGAYLGKRTVDPIDSPCR
jgi:hypothetical protein